MNFFSAKLYILLGITILAALGAGWCAATGMMARGCLLLTAGIVSAAAAISLTDKLKALIHTFLLSLEAEDSTMSFDIKGDRDMATITHVMNRITDLYGRTMLDLTTRKIYFDRVLRVMTHEIRNDLTPVITLSSEMTKNPDCYSRDDMAEALSIISSQSTCLKKFLDSYYELTHIPAPAITRVNVHDFLTGLVESQRAAARALGVPDSMLRMVVSTELVGCFDPDLTARALDNVIRNALESVSHIETPEVVVTASMSDNQILFTVMDNGPGFTTEATENMFMPFYSTKPGGSGIGLFVSRQIARLHKGDLTVRSMPGRRTIVTLLLGKTVC